MCSHQSTRFLRLHRTAQGAGLVVPWINERRVERASSRRFSCCASVKKSSMACWPHHCHSAFRNDSSAIWRSGGEGPFQSGNKVAMSRSLPSIAPDFESSASASSATPAQGILKLRSPRRSSSAPDKIERLQTSRRPENFAENDCVTQPSW